MGALLFRVCLYICALCFNHATNHLTCILINHYFVKQYITSKKCTTFIYFLSSGLSVGTQCDTARSIHAIQPPAFNYNNASVAIMHSRAQSLLTLDAIVWIRCWVRSAKWKGTHRKMQHKNNCDGYCRSMLRVCRDCWMCRRNVQRTTRFIYFSHRLIMKPNKTNRMQSYNIGNSIE